MKKLANGLLIMVALLTLLPLGAYAISLATDIADAQDLEKFGLFVAVGLAGMIGHYAKKWLRREINGGLLDYIFRDHPRETALAVLTFMGAACSVYLSGQMHGMPFGPLVMTAFTTGYTCDSAINKGVL